MHEAIKNATGIEISNCSTCAYLGTEDDGGFPESSQSWHICEKNKGYVNQKPFPFKTEMECWYPEFWHSKQTDLIRQGDHEEVLAAIEAFNRAIDRVRIDNLMDGWKDHCTMFAHEYCDASLCPDCPICDRNISTEHHKVHNLCPKCHGLQIYSTLRPDLSVSSTYQCNMCGGTGKFPTGYDMRKTKANA